MEVIRVKKGETIARRSEKVKAWYIVQEGTVKMKYGFVEQYIGSNAIIGILEQDWFMCDYIAETNVSLIIFPCNGVQDMKRFLSAEVKMRRVFLRTALVQRHQLLCFYAEYFNNIRQFQHFVNSAINDYHLCCAKNRIEVKTNFDVEGFKPLEMKHKAENWEMCNSNVLVKNYMDEYLNLLEKDENMCVAAIMEVSAQMHRVIGGIGEMIDYLKYNKDILLSERKADLFHALFEVEIALKESGKEHETINGYIHQLFVIARKLGAFDEEFLAICDEEYETNSAAIVMPIEVSEEDDLAYILAFAGYEGVEKNKLYDTISRCQKLSHADSKDEDAYQLRKQINHVYYEIYSRCFFAAMERHTKIPTVMEMFFNFGYMDKRFLEVDKVESLFGVATHMDLCRSEHVFTIYEWLKAVYRGDREPSKNEFDMNYPTYLAEQCKGGYLTKEEAEIKKNDAHAKVEFEIHNMFKVVNRLTYGNITMFCPILLGKDMFNAADKMLVTASKVQQALDEIRKIDYSAFYREILNHGLNNEMTHERLMYEILPDVILMPNVGAKAMMWQETASVRNDTPARFMVPILTAADINEMMIEITGRYRWEMCRKVQGVHWNDITDRSLTSEYYDYLQFYRKNRELSTDTKEQIKSALVRAKNNFREVFVKDYQNWIKYEAKGGFRLNKYVRQIVFAYCPFSKSIRTELKGNPTFTDIIERHERTSVQKYKKLEALYEKFKQSGGEITAQMKENIDFYQM